MIKKKISSVPGYIKRVERINPETLLNSELIPKYGKRFTNYRKSYFKTLENNKTNYAYLPEYPTSVLLELLNRCNLDCGMCLSSHRAGKKIIFSKNNLDKLFNDFKKNKLQAIMFGAGEEPFLYKDISNVFDKIDSANIMDTFIFTNGILLTNQRCIEIVRKQIPRIFISIDAATEKTYDIVRPKLNNMIAGQKRLKRLEKNILNLIDIRKKMKSTLPLVRLSFAVQDENKHEINLFKKKWEGIVDFIEFQSCSDYSKIEKLSRKSEKERWKRHPLKKNIKNSHCPSPFQTLTVWADGNVSPCCNFHGKNIFVGNINKESIKQIWKGRKIQELRDQFKNKQLNLVCQNCLSSRRDDLFEKVESKRVD